MTINRCKLDKVDINLLLSIGITLGINGYPRWGGLNDYVAFYKDKILDFYSNELSGIEIYETVQALLKLREDTLKDEFIKERLNQGAINDDEKM